MDVTIARKMIKFPLLGEKIAHTWNVVLSNEFHMTNDSKLFKKEPAPGRLPLFEGKMIHQFSHTFAKAHYWIDSEQGRNSLLPSEMRHAEAALEALAIVQGNGSEKASRQERVSLFLKKHGYPPLSSSDICIAPDEPRLVFRDIARNTDERTLIAAVLPPDVFAGNTLNYLVPWYFNAARIFEHPANIRACYEPRIPATTSAFLCGVFNSFTLDYLLRLKLNAHVNMFYLYQLPVPRLAPDDPLCQAIAIRAARLICVGTEFDILRRQLPGDVNAHVATDVVERRQLQREIDSLVAHLYNLSEIEFKHILAAFPRLSEDEKNLLIIAYQEFAHEPDDLVIAELIAKGENDKVEFKVAACWNTYHKIADAKMRENIIQAVAAFMNKDGGTVLLGVADDGTVVGLEDDYTAAHAQPKMQNANGYQQFLSNVLVDAIGKEFTGLYDISIRTIHGKDVCSITVAPAPEPVYVREREFYVRNGNGKQSLNMKQSHAYIKQHGG